jgi:hypothetical protein
METENSLSCSQEPASGPYLKPDESNLIISVPGDINISNLVEISVFWYQWLICVHVRT